jgi:DNA-directed RNA polymerase specialized sigma24 family protein
MTSESAPSHSGDTPQSRLDNIPTEWSVVLRIHDEADPLRQDALSRLIGRYSYAIRKYLGSLVRDEHKVEELYSRFTLDLLRGRFRNVTPEKGSFRSYLKTALVNLSKTRLHTDPILVQPINSDVIEGVEKRPSAPPEDPFQQAWKYTLMERAWQRLQQHDEEKRKPLARILRLRMERRELRSQGIAMLLRQEGYEQASESWIRKKTHEARQLLLDYLLDEILATLDERPLRETVETELIELGWHGLLKETFLGRWDHVKPRKIESDSAGR